MPHAQRSPKGERCVRGKTDGSIPPLSTWRVVTAGLITAFRLDSCYVIFSIWLPNGGGLNEAGPSLNPIEFVRNACGDYMAKCVTQPLVLTFLNHSISVLGSLVARLLWEQECVGSNPATLTTSK